MAHDHLERHFTQRQFVPEDAAVALGTIGGPAVDRLTGLLRHDDPWIRINAAYALGEAGPTAASDLADTVGELLDDPNSFVVRAAVDALCSLATFGVTTVARLHRLLDKDVEGWEAAAMGERRSGWYWSEQRQVRYVCALALLARVSNDAPPPEIEAALRSALREQSGYTPAIACDGLERLGTTSSLKAALGYLRALRWDPFVNRMAMSMAREARAAGGAEKP
jgi:HEAT repeat protein